MRDTETSERVDGWFVVELMGHRKLAGQLREVQIAGAGFLRLDVPGGATQFYPPSSVYCLTPTTEEIARRFAEHNRPQPVSTYELPALAAGRSEVREADEAEDRPW